MYVCVCVYVSAHLYKIDGDFLFASVGETRSISYRIYRQAPSADLSPGRQDRRFRLI